MPVLHALTYSDFFVLNIGFSIVQSQNVLADLKVISDCVGRSII